MLTLTENARTAVETLTSRAGLPEEGGLRIAEQDSGGFELALVAAPDPGDDTVTAGDAHVYVDPRASATLSDLELDVAPGEGGSQFTLARR